MAKKKIFFIPTYIGPLKHYARLIPYLEDAYDVGFLIIRPDSPRRRETIEYCKEKQFTYYVIDKGITKDNGIRMPFVTPIKKRYEHSAACRNFLETVRPAKIISHKAWSPYDTIFKEANRMGIETIVLQWSSDAGLVEPGERQRSFFQKIYLYLLKVMCGALDVFYKEPRLGYAPAIPKKMGFFHEQKAQTYIEKGYNPRTMRMVGSPDLQLVSELKKKIDGDAFLKRSLLMKYGLREAKVKILVFLYRFYLVSREKGGMTIAEHVAHHSHMLEIMREIFPAEDADIFIKLHPTENAMSEIYDSYKALGIRLYAGESKTDELVCLADLCVAEPTGSVNYMISGSGVPAIFVNFSKLQFLNERMKYFFIKQVVSDTNEFMEKVRAFRNGGLDMQYDTTKVDVHSIDKTIEFINA